MSSALCLCCHLSLFFRSCFTLPFLGLPAVTPVCPLFCSVCEESQLTDYLSFSVLSLSFVCLSFSRIFFPVFHPRFSVSCEDAPLLWNSLILLTYGQDIVSVPLKSNGFGTGKALISAAHCCLCVDARCWPHLLSLHENVCFSLKPSALHKSFTAHACVCVCDRDKKKFHRENENDLSRGSMLRER